ncbi:FmtA-like protein [Planomonospora parontospora subsp. parontospora]|uniref:FmtA-like protein n=2 Tax=Planomonospora parontospora TaxID=58119 RepID=A0AA37F703_9ACTN|nr:serine hydrolase domain-containing protein [Planomonospora parontospora]GGK86228.1 FmtA-like protein [Planomonospora parontospora]GII10873.1 FmtA-like protein [Planomonospora parontospora subsp. parontospora]
MLLELITALVLATTPAQAVQPSDLPGIGALVDEHVSSVMAEEKIPGVTVTVVADGRRVVDKGYGWADAERRLPVDPERTRFLIGSETKLFTAQAALQLVHGGKLHLDADVNSYLTSFEIRDTYPGRPVTLRHLLTHTAGFDDDHILGSGADVRPLGEALAATQPARLRPPGTGVSYSNYGVALAGHLVETVSGMPFEEYVERHVFAPLGMKDSTIACGGLGDTRAYLADGSTTTADCANFAASGAGPASTASDMAAYLQAQLELDPRLGTGVAAEMQQRQHTEDPRLPGMGFMWEESPYKGHRMLFKAGDMPGMHTYMFLLPEQGIGIHVMSNGDGTGRHGLDGFELAHKIIDRYLPGARPPAVQALPGASAERYEGSYQSSRTSHGSLLKVQALTDSPVHVTATADGGVLTTGLKGRQVRWIQFEPGVFQEEGGWDRIAFPEPGQLAISRSTAVFDRIGPLDHPSLHLALLAAALLASLAALLGFPVAAAVRAVRRRSSPPPAGPRVPRLLAWLAAASVVAFTAGFGSLLADQGRALPLVLEGAPVLVALLVLASLTVPLAAALLVCTALAWWRRWWRAPGRIAYTLVSLGVTAFAVVAVAYNLAGLSHT